MPKWRSKGSGSSVVHFPVNVRRPHARITVQTSGDPWGKRRSSISLQQNEIDERGLSDLSVFDIRYIALNSSRGEKSTFKEVKEMLVGLKKAIIEGDNSYIDNFSHGHDGWDGLWNVIGNKEKAVEVVDRAIRQLDNRPAEARRIWLINEGLIDEIDRRGMRDVKWGL